MSIVTPTTALAYVGGVASTVVGSWLSSKIHVYHENRRVHLQEIKERVLIPTHDLLVNEFKMLSSHEKPVVEEAWGEITRSNTVPVTEYLAQHGPFLRGVSPDIRNAADCTLYIDAKTRHYQDLIAKIEYFADAWAMHAHDCMEWISGLAHEILSYSGLPPHPVQHGSYYIMQYRLALFVYRRLFGESMVALQKWNQNPGWVIHGSLGTVAAVANEGIADFILSMLDDIIAKEADKANNLKSTARALEIAVTSLIGDLNYAVLARRLRRDCDLVTFF